MMWPRSEAFRFRIVAAAILVSGLCGAATLAQEAPGLLNQYPIGVFDSGTGGLTVLESILTLDAFDNGTGAPSADGRPDFASERFLFRADQANMPYGNYASQGRTAFLERLVVMDASFLLGTAYAASASTGVLRNDKLPVKALVIACNTATAYGKDDIEAYLEEHGLDIPLIGVVDAGARGALEAFADGQAGTIGVFATTGTALSGAYPAAIEAAFVSAGLSGKIAVVQQGSLGLAGAIDAEDEFLDTECRTAAIRADYRGPSVRHAAAPIDLTLLGRYGFDFTNNRMLVEGPAEHPTDVQLNSVENYVAYEVTTLMENVRKMEGAGPLRAVILGCTHFPFYADEFRRQIARLYDYRENGRYVYRGRMEAPERIVLVDPAYHTAKELYLQLVQEDLLVGSAPAASRAMAEFYITVPDRQHAGVQLDEDGGFTYEYKYGAREGDDFLCTPLDAQDLDPTVRERLEARVPKVWGLMERFREDSHKFR